MNLEALKYPIGKFKRPTALDFAQVAKGINSIETLPQRLKEAVAGWSDEQLDTPYRPEGWTVRQLIHHIADSHINSYIRFRWTLTEDTPRIKAYNEQLWAEVYDAKSAPAELSLNLLDALHQRWVVLLKQLTEEDLKKAYIHPEGERMLPLYANIVLYAWHSEHHLMHVLNLKQEKTW